MSATNRLIDKVLEHWSANEHTANNPIQPHEAELGALAMAADRERGDGSVLIYVRPEDFAGMGSDKASGYLVDHILSQLTPEQRSHFED